MFVCIFVPHFQASEPAQQVLLDCAYAFSPRVENTAPGTVVFDAEGLQRLFGSQDEIAAKVKAQARSFGMEADVAIAANPDTAVALARGGGRPLPDLPIDVLSPPEEILETLHRWGIRTLGSLAGLPAVQISERLGQHGVHLHKLARGAVSRPLRPYCGPLRFEEKMELDYSIETIEALTFILARLLDRLCQRLRARGMATHEVHLALGSYVRVLRLPIPVRNPKLLSNLLILDLEAHPPGCGITSVRIEAVPTKPRIIQNGLFVPLSPEPEKLELTLARISAIVGAGNVGTAEIMDTHRPDAFRMNRVFNGSKGFDPYPPRHTHSLAFRQFRPPLEATVQLKNGIPVRIAFQGAYGAIPAASGPWHTSGDWWTTDRKWNREEWDIELVARLYRIYRDVTANRWYVEGIFD